jgi:hypothetical protein
MTKVPNNTMAGFRIVPDIAIHEMSFSEEDF